MPVFPCFSCIQILRHPLWPRSSAVSLPSRNISRYSHWLLSTSNNGGSFAWHLPLAVSRAFLNPRLWPFGRNVVYPPLILGTDCMDCWHCKSISARDTAFP